MSFDPGLQSMREAGIPATSAPYVGTGAEQIRMSLETMAQKMREGRVDASVRGWALGCLKDHGLDGRDNNTTSFKQGAALLDCLRSATIYAPDPYGVELVPGAAATLCLRPNLCLKGEDCDGLSVAYGSLALSIGLPVQIVKQSWSGQQEHVLCVVYDGNDWQYADPSTNLPFGRALQAENEIWVDPMAPIGALPEAQPTIVTFGKPLGQPATSTWALVAQGSATQPGRRYRLGILIDPNIITPDRVRAVFSSDWIVESAVSTGEVTGMLQSWVIQGIAKTVQQLANTPGIQYAAVAVETVTPASPSAPPTAPASGIDFATVAIATGVAAVGGGLVWAWVRDRHLHPRKRRLRLR